MQQVYFFKREYGNFTFTYFYTKDGLVFTSFASDPIKAFGNFFTDNQAVLQNKENPEITNILENYFATGEKISASSIKIDWKFIKPKPLLNKVMHQLLEEQEVLSYKELGEKIGVEGFRSVATAVGKNPIEVVIPCHLVILSNGKLGEYRDGAKIKQELIELEKHRV